MVKKVINVFNKIKGKDKTNNRKVFKIFSEVIINDIEICDTHYLVFVELRKDRLNSNVIIDKEISDAISNSEEIFLTVGYRGDDLIYMILADEEQFILDLSLQEERLILSTVLFNEWKYR